FDPGVRIVVLLLDATRDQTHLRLRVVDALTVFESPDHIRAVHEAARELVLSRLIRDEKIRRPECKLKIRRQHTDHGVALAVERERASNDSRIAAEASLPHAVSQHRDSWTILRVFAGLEGSSERGIDPKDAEEIRRDARRVHTF